MYYKIEDFVKDWNFEKEATLKIFGNLTDKSLNRRVTEDGRSLAKLAWHITQTIGEMMSRTGLSFYIIDEKADIPTSVSVISKEYEKSANDLLTSISKNWNDETLLTEDDMYGEMWKRGVTLESLVKHQIHHRGQMTVLMRQAGLKVPGVYGPAKEEWAAFGMPVAD